MSRLLGHSQRDDARSLSVAHKVLPYSTVQSHIKNMLRFPTPILLRCFFFFSFLLCYSFPIVFPNFIRLCLSMLLALFSFPFFIPSFSTTTPFFLIYDFSSLVSVFLSPSSNCCFFDLCCSQFSMCPFSLPSEMFFSSLPNAVFSYLLPFFFFSLPLLSL
jgi:hypothetical protein